MDGKRTCAFKLVEEKTPEKIQEEAQEKARPNAYINALARVLHMGTLSAPQEDEMGRRLASELHDELGDKGMAKLEVGNSSVLKDIVPGRYHQIIITKEYLELVAEERGIPELADRANDLEQVRNKATLRKSVKARGLDDEMDDGMEI